MKAVRRTVTDEEFQQALANKDVIRITKAATAKFRGIIPKDDLHNCALHALWRCLGYYIPNKGNKLTTSLWKFIYWECCRELKKIFRNRSHNITTFSTIETKDKLDIADSDADKYDRARDLQECIHTLSPANQQLINKYYFERYTMEDIGNQYGCSKETIRKKLQRAVNELRKVCRAGV
jgi:RNA polymerase sigma factor (sigma-70 family)